MEVVNGEGNDSFLRDKLSRKVMDLAVVYRYFLDDREKSILITENVARVFKVTEEELFDAGIRNGKKQGIQIMSLAKMMAILSGLPEIADCMPEQEGPEPLVCTTKDNRFGAQVICYADYLREISEKANGSFYIIPSSIHELIVVPETGLENLEMLGNFVKEVNGEVVRPDEVLSDHVYYYNAETKELSIAA